MPDDAVSTRRSALAASVRSWGREVKPRRADLKRDLGAAIPSAIAAVPDGMANGVLAGVSPVHGLYASFVGRVAGGLSASTKMMVITTTSAAALTAGSAVASVPDDQRSEALGWLTLIAGRGIYQPTLEEKKSVLLEFFGMCREEMPELPALGKMKQLAGQFTKGLVGGAQFRQTLYHSHSAEEILDNITTYFHTLETGKEYGDGLVEADETVIESCDAFTSPASAAGSTAESFHATAN